jgi:hypothetical protein
VRHPIDQELVDGARTFSLRFACEDCAHFDTEGARCVHGYVERPDAKALETPGGTVAFCKEFELGRGDAP